MKTKYKRKSPKDRLLKKISIDPNLSCWNWTGTKIPSGYGRMWFIDGTEYAHRVSYMLFKGLIPYGLEIDHVCNNRSCVNPDHLQLLTKQENLAKRDMSYAGYNFHKNRQESKKSV